MPNQELPPPNQESKPRKPTRTKQTSFDQRIQTGDPDYYRKQRANLISKRDEYEIDKKGNITDRGVEKYARQMYRTNEPLTKDQLDKAREAVVGGKPVMGMGDKGVKDKVIGTTTGKYGGKLSPQASEKEMKQTQSYLKKRGLTKAFTGDKPPTKDDVKPKPDRVTTGNEIQGPLPAQKTQPKPSKLSVVAQAARKNPAAALAAYDLGKGIVGKITKLRMPAVRGGREGFRSAGG